MNAPTSSAVFVSIPLEWEWESKILELEAFVKEHGHAVVPPRKIPSKAKLHQWLDWQYRLYQTGKLPADRAAQLVALGVWLDNPATTKRERHWWNMLNLLRAYVAKGNDPSMLQMKATVADERLKEWVQRTQWQECWRGYAPAKVEALIECGFPLKAIRSKGKSANREKLVKPVEPPAPPSVYPRTVNDMPWANWNRMYPKLVAFQRRHGHVRVEQYLSEARDLMHFVCHQRRLADAGKLSEYRLSALRELGVNI